MLGEAEHARTRIAGLRARRDGSDLDEAEAQARPRLEALAVLVEPRGEPDTIAEVQPQQFDRIVDRRSRERRGGELGEMTERVERQLVRGLGVELEQRTPREPIEPAHGLRVAGRAAAGGRMIGCGGALPRCLGLGRAGGTSRFLTNAGNGSTRERRLRQAPTS